MAELGEYLYCVIPCQEDHSFPHVGIGEPGGLVHTVCHRGLAAVVSEALVARYESTRKNMMAHEKVLETVMKEFTLLPVRFGSIADSSSPIRDIQKLLERRTEEFQGLLEEMKDKVELGLKAFWGDEKAIFGELLAENPEIRRLRDTLQGKPAEALRFQGISLGQMVKEALNKKRAQEAARILLPLRPLAYRLRENDTLADRVVLNAAFLVERGREPEFDRAIQGLDEELSHRVALKYLGPVPPYNFVNIVVNWQEL